MKDIHKQKEEHHLVLKRMATCLTVALGILTGIVILFAHENPGITGFAIRSSSSGSVSPLIIVGLLLVVIAVYVTMHKE